MFSFGSLTEAFAEGLRIRRCCISNQHLGEWQQEGRARGTAEGRSFSPSRQHEWDRWHLTSCSRSVQAFDLYWTPLLIGSVFTTGSQAMHGPVLLYLFLGH